MILTIQIQNYIVDIYDPLRFSQHKYESCLIEVRRKIHKKCFNDGWIKEIKDVSDMSFIYANPSHSDGLCNLRCNISVEFDYMKPSSIILATVEKIENNLVHLANDRAIVTVPLSFMQDGISNEKNQINMSVFKVNETIPIVIKSRYMQTAAPKARINGLLYIPVPNSIRFNITGKVNFNELWHLITIADKLIAEMEKLEKSKNENIDFIKSVLYPYSTNKMNDLDKMSMVSIVNIAKGVDDVKNCRYVKHSYIPWGVTPYIMKERLNAETNVYEDTHPPNLLAEINTTAQIFTTKLLTDFIYNSELFIEMCNTYNIDTIKSQQNLWKLMNLSK
jgi:hypothetical protein